MDFSLSPEQEDLRRRVAVFVADEIMPVERGGLGLNTVGMAMFYEEAARSRFGPVVFNCAAPDDGNMILLERCATEEQKDRWLQPIIDGAVRSSIVMTEPAPGAGSDPTAMLLNCNGPCSTCSMASFARIFDSRRSQSASERS